MKFFSVLFLLPVTTVGLLSGCGGGSGKSGDDGNVSLSGQQVSLFEGGTMLYRLQFGAQDADVIRMETRTVYDGVYTYRFNEGANSGILNISPATLLEAGEIFRDRKSTRLNSSHIIPSRMPSSA